MYRYRVTSTSRPDNMELVMGAESDGWELVQIVPQVEEIRNYTTTHYYYWFRKPLTVVNNEREDNRERVLLN